MKVYKLTDKEFKTILKKPNQLQQTTDKQLSRIRQTIHQQHGKFSKETEARGKTKQKFQD